MSKKKFNAAVCSLGLAFAIARFSPAGAQEMELYVDTVTKQVYTESGKNRVLMGTFQQVKKGSSQRAQKGSPKQAQKSSRQTVAHNTVADRNELPIVKSREKKEWYEKLKIRGYTQLRTASTVGGDKDAVSYWPDKSVGENSPFLIRRVRVILYGDVSDNLYVYLQPDFASTPSGSSTGNFGQVR